ncbi:MAG: PmoA family protein [Bryobacteraceae bacterium]
MSRLSLLLVVLGLPLPGQVKITQSSDRISVEIDGKPFTALFVDAGVNKPYLHPLRSASGKIVTRSFPMEMVEGERRDHPHHRGLWFAHGDVNGIDYWTNEDSQKRAITGRIALRKVSDLKNGKKSGGFTAEFDWLDPAGNPLLTETKRIVFQAEPNLRTIDFDITLEPAGSKVTFGDTKEGAFAIRLAAGLEEDPKGAPASGKRTGRMVNAEGAMGEKEVWGKRSRWVDCFGEVDGEKLGVAILDHPANPRHPTYWHVRGYGLFAANPFGAREFERDKTKDGSLTLETGEVLRFRYRVIIHPGDARSAGIPARWAAYAKTK